MTEYDRLNNAFVSLDRAHKRLVKAQNQIGSAEKSRKTHCRTSIGGKIWDSWFNGECKEAIANKKLSEVNASIENAKIEHISGLLIRATIRTFGLIPAKMRAEPTGPKSFPLWRPEFSDATDKAYGSMNPRRGIQIYLKPFLESSGGGPERLTLTIFHETVHWLEFMESYEAGLIMTPYLKRMSDYRAFTKEVALARDLNRQLVTLGFSTKFNSKMLKSLEQSADDSRIEAKYVQKHYPNALTEDDLPQRLQMRNLYEKTGASSDQGLSSIEILKDSGEIIFLDSWNIFESEMAIEIASYEQRAKKRREALAQQRRTSKEKLFRKQEEERLYPTDLKLALEWMHKICEKKHAGDVSAIFARLLKNRLDFSTELKMEAWRQSRQNQNSATCVFNLIDAMPKYPNSENVQIDQHWAQIILAAHVRKRQEESGSIREMFDRERRKKEQEELNRMLSKERDGANHPTKKAPQHHPQPNPPQENPPPKRI
ncbi:MAG: hypothetical protein COB53_11485, partial [Elusimicrobia bacterium]